MLDFSAPQGLRGLEPGAEYEDRFAAHMEARERWFRHLFGDTDPPNTILSPGDALLTVHWPGGGILRFGPTPERPTWTYSTSGLAQPVNDDEFAPGDSSGWGIEWVLSTPVESRWPAGLLVRLVKYLLFQQNSRVVAPGDRVPCGPLVPGSALDHVVATVSSEYDPRVVLPAGPCLLVHLVGITSDEAALARSLGTGPLGSLVLVDALTRTGVGLVTNPGRPCLTRSPDLEQVWADSLAAVESWAEE